MLINDREPIPYLFRYLGVNLNERRFLRKHMKHIAIITSALLMTLSVAACNTMEGAGQDIQQGGQNLERAADDHK